MIHTNLLSHRFARYIPDREAIATATAIQFTETYKSIVRRTDRQRVFVLFGSSAGGVTYSHKSEFATAVGPAWSENPSPNQLF